jgi:hypothetical protein
MFGSEILEIFIGLLLMFLLFSLIMTAARETLESVLKSRANMLQKALGELLRPQGNAVGHGGGITAQDALKVFNQHPLIFALYPGDTVKTGWLTNAPSYIPSTAFASAVLDLVNAGQKLPPDSAVAKAYQIFLQKSVENSEKAKVEMAAFYDSVMERAGGWYRRQTQWFMIIVGFLLALALNLNAVVIAKHLSVDQTVLESIVRLADNVGREQIPLSPEQINVLNTSVRATGLPIGWGETAKPYMPKMLNHLGIEVKGEKDKGEITIIELLLGYLAFALAATLGAPFWFDMLSKFIAIRSTIKPNAAQGVTESQAVVTTPERESGPPRDRLHAPEQPFIYG